MSRLLNIIIAPGLLLLVMMPVLTPYMHHHDGAETHEATCDGDCGCMCHIRAFVVMESDIALAVPRITSIVANRHLSYPSAEPQTIDHPPELFS